MNVSRRQSLLAMVVTVVAFVVDALMLRRLGSLTRFVGRRQADGRLDVRRASPRRVEPAPHSVKRHA